MAFDPNQEDPNKQQNQSATANPTTSSAPGAGPGAATGKNAASPQSAPTQPFQNLQSYLTANAPQVNQQAENIAGNLNNQYGQVQSDVNKATSEFGNQVKGGYAAQNDDVVNQAASNPTAFVSNPDNVKAFQSLYNDTYTGPTSFESSEPYGSISKEVSSAAQNASNFDSIPGMQTYFQGQNPNATKGGNILDSVLLQGNPEAVSQVQNAAKPFANLNDYLNTATTQANRGATEAQKAAGDISKNVQGKFIGEKGIIPEFQSGINSQVDQKRQEVQQNLDRALQDLNSGNLSEQDALVLGTQPGMVNDTLNQSKTLNTDYGIPLDIKSYLSAPNPIESINAGNVASKDDYQKAAALAQLTGQDLSSFLKQTDMAKAGTAPTSLQNLNATDAYKFVTDNIKQSDNQWMNTHPLPSQDPGMKTLQMDVVSRNPGLLNNPTWQMWYQQNGGTVPGTGPTTGTPSAPTTPGIINDPNVNNPINTGGGTTYVDPTTGETKKAF